MRLVADFCNRLTRLNVMDEARPLDPQMLIDELDKVCVAIWRCTLDNFDPDLIPQPKVDWYEAADEEEAEKYAAERGYDLSIPGADSYLHDFWDFVMMILAEEHGLLTKERQVEWALRRDALDFVDNKQRGVISGR